MANRSQKLSHLTRGVAFIATLMDSRGFDLAIADMARATASRAHGRCRARATVICAHAKRARPKATGIKLGNLKQAEINRAKAAEQAQALRPAQRAVHRGSPHVEPCDVIAQHPKSAGRARTASPPHPSVL